jgi:hypothetical protein
LVVAVGCAAGVEGIGDWGLEIAGAELLVFWVLDPPPQPTRTAAIRRPVAAVFTGSPTRQLSSNIASTRRSPE